MKAVEFIKIHGWEEVKRIVSTYTKQTHVTDDARMFINADGYAKQYPHFKDDIKTMVAISDLKEYVNAYELVQSYKCKRYTGLSNAKDHVLTLAHIEEYEKMNKLQSAIYLVEEIEA